MEREVRMEFVQSNSMNGWTRYDFVSILYSSLHGLYVLNVTSIQMGQNIQNITATVLCMVYKPSQTVSSLHIIDQWDYNKGKLFNFLILCCSRSFF